MSDTEGTTPDLTALAADVQAMTRYYGDWRGLYDSAQMFAHVRLLLEKTPALLSAVASLKQAADLREEKAWNDGWESANCQFAEVTRQLDAARKEAEQAQAVVAAAYKFADDMHGFCSPYGVSAHYAEQLRTRLNLAAEATSAPQPKGAEPTPPSDCPCVWTMQYAGTRLVTVLTEADDDCPHHGAKATPAAAVPSSGGRRPCPDCGTLVPADAATRPHERPDGTACLSATAVPSSGGQEPAREKCPSAYPDPEQPLTLWLCVAGAGHDGKHWSRHREHEWTDAEQYDPNKPEASGGQGTAAEKPAPYRVWHGTCENHQMPNWQWACGLCPASRCSDRFTEETAEAAAIRHVEALHPDALTPMFCPRTGKLDCGCDSGNHQPLTATAGGTASSERCEVAP